MEETVDNSVIISDIQMEMKIQLNPNFEKGFLKDFGSPIGFFFYFINFCREKKRRKRKKKQERKNKIFN